MTPDELAAARRFIIEANEHNYFQKALATLDLLERDLRFQIRYLSETNSNVSAALQEIYDKAFGQ